MTVSEPVMKGTYRDLVVAVRGLLDGEHDYIANAANLAAYAIDVLPEVNWIGFYFVRNNELVVGPFAGKPACTRIAIGTGVCGTAVAQEKTLVVEDVHQFDGHIACDPLSRSEVVVPLWHGGRIIGVLDVDSPVAGRFDDQDAAGLEALAEVYVSSLAGQWPGPA